MQTTNTYQKIPGRRGYLAQSILNMNHLIQIYYIMQTTKTQNIPGDETI